jgi:hypothetical protein
LHALTRQDLGQAFDVAAPQRLIFVRRRFAQRVPGIAWVAALVCVLLLGWPSA